MFYKYKVIDNVLYLYVDDKCEIGSFFGRDKDNLLDKVKKYIKDMKIKFNGTKVVLILSGLMLGTIYLNNNIKENNYDVYKNTRYVYNVVDKTYPKFENINNEEKEVNEGKVDENNEVKFEEKTKQNTNANAIINNKTVNEEIKKEEISNTYLNENKETKGAEKKVTVKRSNGEIINIELEKYLIGVVAAEMPASFEKEALKAQSVVARTYTKKLLDEGRVLTDTVSTQVYKSDDELKTMWGPSYNTYYNKVKEAVESTKNLYITYNGNVIDAVYHSTSNGYTEDPINVWGYTIPYLKTVPSPWDTSASSFLRESNISFDELSKKLGLDFNKDTLLDVISRDDSGRISKIKVGEKQYTGVELRNIIGLRSADFDAVKKDGYVLFTTRGYGHGVGMSQYGANGMAKSGYNYDEILKYYYTNIEIVTL